MADDRDDAERRARAEAEQARHSQADLARSKFAGPVAEQQAPPEREQEGLGSYADHVRRIAELEKEKADAIYEKERAERYALTRGDSPPDKELDRTFADAFKEIDKAIEARRIKRHETIDREADARIERARRLYDRDD